MNISYIYIYPPSLDTSLSARGWLNVERASSACALDVLEASLLRYAPIPVPLIAVQGNTAESQHMALVNTHIYTHIPTCSLHSRLSVHVVGRNFLLPIATTCSMLCVEIFYFQLLLHAACCVIIIVQLV